MNVLLVGIGGQGIIVASKILAETTLRAGFDVKKSEVHGMAQRGGSVISHVRFGTKVFSPLIKKGEGDILLAFEQLETMRYLEYLRRDSIVLINNQEVLPPSVSMGVEGYPENIFGKVKKRFKNTLLINGLQIAKEAGNLRTLNIALLGISSQYLQIADKFWLKTIKENFPPPLQEVNMKAFQLGKAFSVVSADSE